MTLARRHWERSTAAAASAAAGAGEPINASAYELQLAKLYEDKRRLKDVQSIERKIDIKRQILPDYSPWIEGVLEAGRGGQDAVLMTVMVWRIDTGDHYGALQIAAYALEHDLALPDQYQRTAGTLIAEEIADQALQAFGTGGAFDVNVLEITEQLTRGQDMPDEVRAKLHKALGLAITGQISTDAPSAACRALAPQALEHLRRALQLHDRVGVKKDIERLERFTRNNPADASSSSSSDGRSTESPQSNAAEPGALADPAKDPTGAPAPATSAGT